MRQETIDEVLKFRDDRDWKDICYEYENIHDNH